MAGVAHGASDGMVGHGAYMRASVGRGSHSHVLMAGVGRGASDGRGCGRDNTTSGGGTPIEAGMQHTYSSCLQMACNLSAC
eukprot:365186-Chlamydomonas_euryale.AAC.12